MELLRAFDRVGRGGRAWAAVIVLAAGLGSAVAVLTAAHAVLAGAVPFDDPDRLVHLRESTAESPRRWVAWANYFDWRERTVTAAGRAEGPFEEMAAHGLFGAILTAAQPLERAVAVRATAELFPMLGARAAIGRLYGPPDDRPGAAPVVVLDHHFWQSRYGGRTDVIGEVLEIENERHEIVGVMAPDFLYPRTLRRVSFYLPLGASSDDWGRRSEEHPGLSVTARLRPGVSRNEAKARLDAVAADLAGEYPETNRGHGVQLLALRQEVAGRLEGPLLALAVAAGLVLLLASVSFANLLLVRFVERSEELQTRAALGAPPLRLACTQLAASVRQALMAALLALPLAAALLASAARLIRVEKQPAFGELALGVPSLAGAAVLALLVGLGAGAPVAVMAARLANASSLAHRRATTRRRPFRVLVAIQLAMALALAIGATLTSRSYTAILNTDPGFEAAGIADFRVLLPETEMSERARADFYAELGERVRGLPDVEAATLATPLLRGFGTTFEVQGEPEKKVAEALRVDPHYFDTLDIAILRGRRLDDGNFSGDEVAVCERFAARHWPQGDAIGARLRLADDPEKTWRRVVAVVRHVKNRGVHRESRPQFYLHLGEAPATWASLALRASPRADPTRLARTASTLVGELRTDALAGDVEALVERVEADRHGPRLLTACFLFFATATLIIAVFGAYGLVAASVADRRRELGVHTVLGARPADLRRLVLGEALMLAATGGGAGLLLAALGAGWLSSQLFDVRLLDPWPWLLWPILLTATVALAATPAAHRASAVDPARDLRGH